MWLWKPPVRAESDDDEDKETPARKNGSDGSVEDGWYRVMRRIRPQHDR